MADLLRGVLELAQRCRASMVLTLGALLAEVAHTQPIRLSGSSYDPELSERLGLKPTRYEGPTGIVGVLNILCREARVPTASLWANVPHYVSGIENPRAALALVRRVLTMLDTEADLTDLREAAEQFDQNLTSIVAQNSEDRRLRAPARAQELGRGRGGPRAGGGDRAVRGRGDQGRAAALRRPRRRDRAVPAPATPKDP